MVIADIGPQSKSRSAFHPVTT